MFVIPCQVGGWWRMKASVWPGFLLLTWSCGTGRMMQMLNTSKEVCAIFSFSCQTCEITQAIRHLEPACMSFHMPVLITHV